MKAVAVQDVANIRTETISMPQDWQLFLGNLPRNDQWKAIIHGGSFSGKSTFVLLMAQMLSRFGRVLYGNFEEAIQGGSIQNKLRSIGVRNANIDFLEANTYDNFVRLLESGKYRYAVIDSLSVLGDSRRMILERFNDYAKFPKVSFIYLLHADKSEKVYIGPSALKHNVDIAIELVQTIAISKKNRFKQGEQIKYIEFETFKNKVVKPITQRNYHEKQTIPKRQIQAIGSRKTTYQKGR